MYVTDKNGDIKDFFDLTEEEIRRESEDFSFFGVEGESFDRSYYSGDLGFWGEMECCPSELCCC